MRLSFSLFFAVLFAVPAFSQTLPLSTSGRSIIDADGERFRLKSANWYGANLESEVVGGLDQKPLPEIVSLIKSWGFNSIRLPFSNQMLHRTTPVPPAAVAANPNLVGLRPIEVYDAVVKELTAQGLLVILNNHSTSSIWCCGFDNNGLWYYEGSDAPFSEKDWQNDWTTLVDRYRDNPGVVGVDLRNEVRTAKYKGTFLPIVPLWGSNNAEDWRRAAQDAGRLVLQRNPNLLVIVEAINWEGTLPILGSGNRPFLAHVPEFPIHLPVPNKLVYAVHSYSFIGPHHNGDSSTSKGQIRYSDMDEATLRETWRKEWSFVLDEGTYYNTPIWVSEFGIGADDSTEGDRRWFNTLASFIAENDLDFAYWPINSEGYGLVDGTYSHKLDQDWRRDSLLKILGETTPHPRSAQPQFRSLDIRRSDDNLTLSSEDWLPYAAKGTCPEGYALVGMSQDYRGLCRESQGKGGNAVVTSEVSPPLAGYDWAVGATKYECPRGTVAAGFSKSAFALNGLLCRPFASNTGRCQVRSAEHGDDRPDAKVGDFASGSYKAQCADHQVVVGIAHKSGRFVSELCCDE